MPAKSSPDRHRGPLILFGALSDGERDVAVVARLLAHVGSALSVLVMATGEHADTATVDLEALLRAAGAVDVHRRQLAGRSECASRALLDLAESVRLIVLAAEHPLQLSTVIGGTPLARVVRRRNADGVAVAGFGGAAPLLCEHMVAGSGEGLSPKHGRAQLAPGLGLTNRVLIDQGGHASDRLGRLLAALALNPFALGVGLDAGTAIVIGPDNVLDVFGSGGVTLIDPSEMADSNAVGLDPGAPIQITNLRLHALAGGARYDLDFRRTVG